MGSVQNEMTKRSCCHTLPRPGADLATGAPIAARALRPRRREGREPVPGEPAARHALCHADVVAGALAQPRARRHDAAAAPHHRRACGGRAAQSLPASGGGGSCARWWVASPSAERRRRRRPVKRRKRRSGSRLDTKQSALLPCPPLSSPLRSPLLHSMPLHSCVCLLPAVHVPSTKQMEGRE